MASPSLRARSLARIEHRPSRKPADAGRSQPGVSGSNPDGPVLTNRTETGSEGFERKTHPARREDVSSESAIYGSVANRKSHHGPDGPATLPVQSHWASCGEEDRALARSSRPERTERSEVLSCMAGCARNDSGGGGVCPLTSTGFRNTCTPPWPCNRCPGRHRPGNRTGPPGRPRRSRRWRRTSSPRCCPRPWCRTRWS